MGSIKLVIWYGVEAETDTKFGLLWILAWGTEKGYFRIVRGIDNLAIEQYCVWATVDDTSLNLLDLSGFDSKNVEYANSDTMDLCGGLLAMKSDMLSENSGVQTSPLPEDYDGNNLLNIVRQSNKPYKCDSCWAFIVTEIVSDRLNIMEYLRYNVGIKIIAI